MRRVLIIVIVVVAGLAVIGGAALWRSRAKRNPSVVLRTVSVKRGNLVTISATGTVEPEEVVDVGAQVAGQINTFGKDKNGKQIDYGSVVEADMVLAQIDDSLYTANVQQTQANLSSAEANVLQARAKLEQARQDWERAQKLGPSEALAPSAYDQYKANFEIGKANVAVTEAAVAQAKAALVYAQRNLSYCTIKSPVNGVIIDRRVNVGQTVVASLNTPSLFLIAKDLTRIQVWVSVNEADIGEIRPGQPVSFTVDAFPRRVFQGQVGKVRLNATMTQNVVTYTVEVNTENADGKLLPYLTANAQFETGRREGVLLVPNTALRWTPRAESAVPVRTQHGHGTVWVEQDGAPRAINVNTGLSDGTLTEVSGDELSEGMKVVIGEQTTGAAVGPDGGASPFAPQFGRSQQRGTGGSGR